MRYPLWLVALLLIGCGPKPSSQTQLTVGPSAPQQPPKTLKEQAQAVGEAALREDHAKMADLTLPALVEKFGGRAQYIKKLQSVAAEMKGSGFGLMKHTVGEPSQVIQVAGEGYAVIPVEVQLSGPNGATGKQPSFLIAVSRDGGGQWGFIDGAGVGSDRKKLKMLLPNFPDTLPLPAQQPAVWNK
jgi:hypothetical protein